MTTMNKVGLRFSKVLAKYYIKWYQDSVDSAVFCYSKNDPARAADYIHESEQFLIIIMENWDAIEFFSVDGNAFINDSALPVEFRDYE